MKKLLWLLLVVIVSGCTCALSKDERAGKEWVTEYSVDVDVAELKDVTFFEVEDSYRQSAIHQLASQSHIEISKEKAALYTNDKIKLQSNKRFFLVRSVYGYLGSGGYEVKYDGNYLIVNHSSLGSCMLYNKSALVVELNSDPKQVYVSVSVAG